MLTPSQPLLANARASGYAVGSFNVVGFESARAIIAAAEAERSPALLMIWSGFGDVDTISALAASVRWLGERATVPIALHLDHEADIGRLQAFLEAGFTSVMIDGGGLSLDDNIAVTREAIGLARSSGASVEAVVGEIGDEGGGGRGEPTAVEDAVRFWEETQVDVLAVSVGTQHGHYEGEPPKLALDRLRAVGERVPAPLVLHGGSYCAPDQLRAAVELGIAKVNIATELDDVFLDGVRKVDLAGARWVSDVIGAGFAQVERSVREKMQLFGSTGGVS